MLNVGKDRPGGPTEEDEIASAEAFMFQFVKTFDPLDERQPIKLLPKKPHIRDWIRDWQRNRKTETVKSRQMQATWSGVGIYCWDTYRHQGRFTIFKSTDKAHSGLGTKLALLWRAKFIHDHLPSVIRPRINPKRRDHILEFPDTNGIIVAMSMEGDASVSFTATGCLDDELALQQYGEAGFTVVQPLLGETGRYTALTTPRGENFAYRLAYDKLDD